MLCGWLARWLRGFECGESGFCEGTQCSSHPTYAIDSLCIQVDGRDRVTTAQPERARARFSRKPWTISQRLMARDFHTQPNRCLKQMPAQLFGCSQQVIFSLMQSTGRRFQSRMGRLRRASSQKSKQPSKHPAARPGISPCKPTGKPVMLSKEFPIQQLDRFPRFMAPVSRRRSNADFNPTTQLRLRQNRAKEAAHRISKVAVQSVFELCMTQDGKQFRHQLYIALPDCVFR